MERLAELLDLYQLSLGSIGYILDQLEEMLRARGDEEALAYLERAREKFDRGVELRTSWDLQKKKDPLDRSGTHELDARIDRLLTSLRDTVEVHTNLESAPERSRLAEEFIDDLLPRGVFPLTSKPYAEQHAHVDVLTSRLREKYAEHIEVLGVEPIVEEIEELNAEFGELLEPDRDRVEYDEVEAAYVEAEDAVHRLLINVLDGYADDMEELNELLEPLFFQIEQTRRHLKRRGSVPEVDRETGEPRGDGSGDSDGGDAPDDGG